MVPEIHNEKFSDVKKFIRRMRSKGYSDEEIFAKNKICKAIARKSPKDDKVGVFLKCLSEEDPADDDTNGDD